MKMTLLYLSKSKWSVTSLLRSSDFNTCSSSLTEEKVCLHVTAAWHTRYEFPELSKSFETESAIFYGRGALKQLPRGRRRLKWFA